MSTLHSGHNWGWKIEWLFLGCNGYTLIYMITTIWHKFPLQLPCLTFTWLLSLTWLSISISPHTGNPILTLNISFCWNWQIAQYWYGIQMLCLIKVVKIKGFNHKITMREHSRLTNIREHQKAHWLHYSSQTKIWSDSDISIFIENRHCCDQWYYYPWFYEGPSVRFSSIGPHPCSYEFRQDNQVFSELHICTLLLSLLHTPTATAYAGCQTLFHGLSNSSEAHQTFRLEILTHRRICSLSIFVVYRCVILKGVDCLV